MRKRLFLILGCFICFGFSEAAVRNESSLNRTVEKSARNSNTLSSRTATTKSTVSRLPETTSQTISTRTNNSSNATSSRSAINTNPVVNTARTATSTVSRAATTPSVSRTATVNTARNASPSTISRTATVATNTFGTGYNACRNAYFTCMDQFCATLDDTYRRCICSDRIDDIKRTEAALKTTESQLTNFQDLNIYAATKTADEINAIVTASEGENAVTDDESDAAAALLGISSVLETGKSLSTAGKLDIAGDISNIWTTTDFTSGSNLINLEGEELYNAVNSQCAEFVMESCESSSTMDMVISAYGMYIENDCTLLATALDSQVNQAYDAIAQTEFALNDARLENYNTLNSLSINECIAGVRDDLTADSACGADYVHCLDTTGKYLDINTGEPIYSAEFYELENQISLSGDVLQNQENLNIIQVLNSKKLFADDTLNQCSDLSMNVWEEFMRQAIVEIYQNQQNKIRDAQSDCIDVVNACYDTQTNSLKDFSDANEQLLLGERMELSETLCSEKLDTCSNLYGGGATGLAALVETMTNITDQIIAENCKATLEEYTIDLCALPSNDSIHLYPYGCRTYAPGDQKSATVPSCNISTTNIEISAIQSNPYDKCLITGDNPVQKIYSGCKPNYYMTLNGVYNATPTAGNQCTMCGRGNTCTGGTANQIYTGCGDEYEGSLYQKLVQYATQACIRPSEISSDMVLPTTILTDINMVMDSIKSSMANELSDECERLGGIWVSYAWVDEYNNETNELESDGKHDSNNDTLLSTYVSETRSNLNWGYCKPVQTGITAVPSE